MGNAEKRHLSNICSAYCVSLCIPRCAAFQGKLIAMPEDLSGCAISEQKVQICFLFGWVFLIFFLSFFLFGCSWAGCCLLPKAQGAKSQGQSGEWRRPACGHGQGGVGSPECLCGPDLGSVCGERYQETGRWRSSGALNRCHIRHDQVAWEQSSATLSARFFPTTVQHFDPTATPEGE